LNIGRNIFEMSMDGRVKLNKSVGVMVLNHLVKIFFIAGHAGC
jgi:hypothetical protein